MTFYGKLKRQIARPPYPRLEDGKLYLHLGCGSINHEKFVNIDALPAPHIHYIRSLDNLSPFKDETVDLIYASHCLEHFSHRKIPSILEEWFRVLKPGGVLRLSVPDFDAIYRIYSASHDDLNAILEILMGGQNYKYNFHMAAFNQASMAELLSNAGFKSNRPWEPGSCDLTRFSDFSVYTILVFDQAYPMSLNIEAIK